MDRDELVEFIRKMRGRDFTNEEIRFVREIGGRIWNWFG